MLCYSFQSLSLSSLFLHPPSSSSISFPHCKLFRLLLRFLSLSLTVASKVMNEPVSWLHVFSMPPIFKVPALMKKFPGQKQAVASVAYSFLRRQARTQQNCWPLGSFLVCDPSGQYWEEFARALSQILFDSSDVCVRINLSEADGSPSGGGHDNMRKLFEDVGRTPYGVIVFEKIERAEDCAVCLLNQILETGYALSYEGDTWTDFTKSLILIILQDLSPFLLTPCKCLGVLRRWPFKTYLRTADSNRSGAQGGCACTTMLKEASSRVSAVTLELVDDVVLLGSQHFTYHVAYARTMLREMAEEFFDGRLILYPSEAALRRIVCQSDNFNGEKGVKTWLEKHVRPVLVNMVNKGVIDEKSVILLDTYAGSTSLTYMVENREDRCRSSRAKKFKNWAASMRLAFEKGKYLEECIGCVIEKLDDFPRELIPLPGSVEVEELISLTHNAISVAMDLKSVKVALGSLDGEGNGMIRHSSSTASDVESAAKETEGSRARETDVTDSVRERFKMEQEALDFGLDSFSECPVIISSIAYDLLKPGRSSAVSFLLLGLREEGKKELVNGLVQNLASYKMVRIFAMDMSDYSDEDSLFSLKNSPLRTLSDNNENLALAEAVRKHPYSILYFDKIEKANIGVYGWLLSLLRCGVLTDNEGNEVDFQRTVVIFGSDSGNQLACAQLAGHFAGVDSGSVPELQKKQPCQLRLELLCKVDRLVVFNPLAPHQLKSMRSYSVEDLRHWAVGADSYELLRIFSFMFYNGEVPRPSLKILDTLGCKGNKNREDARVCMSREWLPGWMPSLPDPCNGVSPSYLRDLHLV